MSYRVTAFALIAFSAFAGSSHAESCQKQTTADLWAEEDIRIVGIDIAFTACPGWSGSVRYGLSYFADDDFLYEGITGSLRFHHGDVLVPHIGIGALGGIAEKTISASEDGLDNDDDGFIDEPGEEITLRETSAFLYPEVGVTLHTNRLGTNLSARQYFGKEFTGNIIYSFGVSIAVE